MIIFTVKRCTCNGIAGTLQVTGKTFFQDDNEAEKRRIIILYKVRDRRKKHRPCVLPVKHEKNGDREKKKAGLMAKLYNNPFLAVFLFRLKSRSVLD